MAGQYDSKYMQLIIKITYNKHNGYDRLQVHRILRKRGHKKAAVPEKKWCISVIENPIKVEPQEHNRFRFWGAIQELDDRILRVITLSDKKTIHNAFPDRGFKQ